MSQDYEVHQDAELEHYKQANDELEAEACRLRDAIMKLATEADVHGKHGLAKTLRETARGDA